MAGIYPPVGVRPQRPKDWAEATVVRDPWRWWRSGAAFPPVGPFVYPFPQVPQRDELAGVGWYRPDIAVPPPQAGRQIAEEIAFRPAVEPGGYTVDELLGGNVRRRTGMNSNVPAAGK